MKLKLTIEMDNAAFADGNSGPEAARILREAAGRIADGERVFNLRDFNGNKVGAVKITGKENNG